MLGFLTSNQRRRRHSLLGRSSNYGLASDRPRGALENSSSDELLGYKSLDNTAFLARIIGPVDGLLVAGRLGVADRNSGFSGFL